MTTDLKYAESLFPREFGDSHVDALRTLLSFAKGQVANWSDLGGEIGVKSGPLDQTLLSKFIRFERRLGFPTDLTGVRRLHRDLYNFFRTRDQRLLDPLMPLFDHLYKGGEAAHRSTWRALEVASQAHGSDELMQHVIQSVSGCYYIYRYGFDGNHKSSVFKSVIEIYDETRFGRSCLKFRAHYPPTDAPSANSDVYITGEILAVGQYLFLLGHDLNTDAPYVLAVKRTMSPSRAHAGEQASQEFELHGLLMRFEGTDMVFAARAYVMRTKDSWETACRNSELVASKLFEREFVGFAGMRAFIDNVITGSNRPVLADYRPGAREDPMDAPE